MTKRPLSAQLDAAITAALGGKPGRKPQAATRSRTLVELVRLAGDLRDLPREQFREQLKADLFMKGSTTMSSHVREGFLSVTPYLVSSRAPELLEFVKQAFGAQEAMRSVGGAGGMHAEARLGDSMVMIGGGLQYQGPDHTCALHFSVPDVDAVYNRALGLGATSIYPPTDHEYGERGAVVKDLAGNTWYIATVKGESFHWPGLPQLQPYFHANGAAAFIDLLVAVFDGQLLGKHADPSGRIAHATVRIGTATVEASEAIGPYQPMPSMLYVYVPDADAVYQRALAAGCTSLSEPADQPYGDRSAAVQDPFGNSWYIATHKGDGA
jgi:PhnB protein